MALAGSSWRATELSRNNERPLAKPRRSAAGPTPLLVSTGGAQPDMNAPHSSRDSSPDCAALMRRGSTFGSTTSLTDLRDDSFLTVAFAPFSAAASADEGFRSFPAAPPPSLALETCSSFGEQRPQSTKPVFLERHGTLRHVHLSTLVGKAAAQLDACGQDDGSISPSKPIPLQHASGAAIPGQRDSAAPYLPSWHISRSRVWLLAESALQRAQTALPRISACEIPAPAPSASSHSDEAHSDEARSGAEPGTPFAGLCNKSSLISSPSLQPGNVPGAPRPRLQLLSPGLPSPLPPLPPLRRARSDGRQPCGFVPRGLGPLPLPLRWLTPRASAFAPRRSAPTERGDVLQQQRERGAAAAGAGHSPRPAGSGGVPDALAHFGAAAAAGVAAAVSSIHSTSVAVQLGANAVNAGTDLLLNQYQGALIKMATSVVADKVLGPAASPSLRLALRQRLRATVAGASVLWFFVNTSAMGDTLMHMGLDHDVVTSAKMVMQLVTSGPGLLDDCRQLLQVGLAVGLGVAQRNTGGIIEQGSG